MNKQAIKQFLKPNKKKILVFAILVITAIFVGFFNTSQTLTPSSFSDENGIIIASRTCGTEGIFNPLLRPFSFVIGNLVMGLISEGDIVLCGADIISSSFFPIDIICLYFLSCLIIFIYNKLKIRK